MRSGLIRFLPTCGLLCALAVSATAFPVIALARNPATGELRPELREFFEKQVRPLLIRRCFECHGGAKAGGGLSLASAKGWRAGGESGPVIVPGQPEQSLLIDAINYRLREMPPADKGGKLPPEEIAILTQWVAMGAPDPRDGGDVLGGMSRDDAQAWWAFQPLPAADATDVSRVIDTLIEREWQRHGLTPQPRADKRTLIRRATYDLTGLPPTPDEVRTFLADESPDAFMKVVHRLLESPQYGVQWGRHWLDVVRYADTAGENTDRPLPHAWRYRNWVFDAFQRDLPFDQFARMQLAGDLIAKDQPQRAEGIIATGYLAVARRFGHDIDKDMYLTHEDVIDNLGRNFLGLTLGCARCHDHKYDPVSSEDYYALYGIFDSTRFAFPGCEPKGQPRDLVPLLPEVDVEAVMKPWRERDELAKTELQRRAELSKRVLTSESAQATRLIHKGDVTEGASVELATTQLAVHQNEVLLLTVEPGGNHGADSTQVDLSIVEVGGLRREWSTRDVVSSFTASNPRPLHDALWCFIEITGEGPAFLAEKGDSISGNSALKKWSRGDTPSAFVNSSDQQISAWTTLPANSLFVHPGPGRPVTVAWICPVDGEITIRGRVADVHPAGLDGVAFRLEHIARPETGLALAEVGRTSAESAPILESEPVIPVAYAVVDRIGRNARLHERGDPEKLGREVPRRWLSVFGGNDLSQGSGSGRRELAEWITRNPLLARVIVNRIWEWHFGRGLVRTSNDFGTRGEKPTHPELVDRLAAEFMHSGCSIKAMHRRIMLSDAFQRASAPPPAADPENRWLAHFNRRRLSAEELRDSLLTMSGEIDLSPAEAHPFPPEVTWKFTQHAPFYAVYESNHRSAFLMVQRQRRHPFLALFDGADPNASTPARQTTNVPTQALYFMNDPFFHQQAAAVAARLTPLADNTIRTVTLFQSLFQREPTAAERDRVVQFLASYPGEPSEQWAALCRVLLASNEFLHVE